MINILYFIFYQDYSYHVIFCINNFKEFICSWFAQKQELDSK